MATAPHPYHPPTLEIEYAAPSRSAPALVMTIGAGFLTTIVCSWILLRRARVSGTERAVGVWFTVNGILHAVFEGYYLLNHRNLASRTTILADLWKEYAKSDSRYLSQDTMTLALESVTVLTLPALCCFAVSGIVRKSPGRYIAQLVASVVHLYSVALYYGTELLSRESNCRPEPMYYYGYFVLMNLPWVVVPAYLAVSASAHLYRGMAILKWATRE